VTNDFEQLVKVANNIGVCVKHYFSLYKPFYCLLNPLELISPSMEYVSGATT